MVGNRVSEILTAAGTPSFPGSPLLLLLETFCAQLLFVGLLCHCPVSWTRESAPRSTGTCTSTRGHAYRCSFFPRFLAFGMVSRAMLMVPPFQIVAPLGGSST